MNEVAKQITEEIKARGPISFARFMELALYCPVYGYYEKEQDTPGRAGDFYTSVSVGSLFGELLGLQFAQWFDETLKLGAQKPLSGPPAGRVGMIEGGAHDGQLALDVLSFFQERRPELLAPLEYWIVEPSPRRRAWQERRLLEFGPKVRWVAQLGDLPRGLCGVLFSNELLDARAVHRLSWDARARRWREWGVGLEGDRFAWAKMTDSSMAPVFPGQWERLLRALPDGFTLDTAPAAEAWWREAANTLDQGRLLTIDYGFTTEELLAPQRNNGTLRAYSRHAQRADVLARPGAQDLTAHLNFSVLQAAGESAGFETETFTTQEAFLTRIAAPVWEGKTAFGEWTPARTRQFRTLTHPQLLGRAFRVLVQRRVRS